MTKKTISDQERLELASKLDQDLDNFINSLPQRAREESVPFDRWEEEIINHPFFMKDVPTEDSPMHPLYEGLQKLKYDPEENEPEELALAYKDDGNVNFKHKKYRMAIISYTEGLKAKCGNPEIETILYNNRSASHYFLGNFRSALIDANLALKLKPDYEKALMRAATCCHKLEKFDKAIVYCDKILVINKTNVEALELRKNSINEGKMQERNKRKRDLVSNKLRQEQERIVDEIQKRGIKIEGGSDNLTLSKLEPQFPELFNSKVSLNEENRLVWPVIFFYPEYKIMDYIQHFDECTTFLDQLAYVFESNPEWDKDNKYKVPNLNIYFEDEKKRNIKIDVNKSLLEILKLDGHVIKNGTPKFIILVANSKVERLFLEQF